VRSQRSGNRTGARQYRPDLGDAEAPDGSEVEASYLTKTVDRVGTKPGHVLNLMCFADVPQTGRREIPFRVKAQADEIPNDIDEYVIDRIIGIEHRDAI
jgi:hypothetical protein